MRQPKFLFYLTFWTYSFISCQKDQPILVADAPNPNIAIDSPAYFHRNFYEQVKDVYEDYLGNVFVIAGQSAYRLDSTGKVVNQLDLGVGRVWYDNVFNEEGGVYTPIRKIDFTHSLIYYRLSRYTYWYASPLLVPIQQSTANDKVSYQFLHGAKNNSPQKWNEHSILQTATKFVKNGNTGKIDTMSVLLLIDPANTASITTERILLRRDSYKVMSNDKYILLIRQDGWYYQYNHSLNLVDSFGTLGNGPLLTVLGKYFLVYNRGYNLSDDGTTKLKKIEKLDDRFRIICSNKSFIYTYGISGDLLEYNLDTDSLITISNTVNMRFDLYRHVGVNYVWKNRKGRHFIFTSAGLYVY